MSRRVWAASIVSTVSLVYVFRLDRAAGLMVDDAWYILLAKALAGGDGYRLISSATVAIMPVVPPGFPALLAPVFVFGPAFPGNLLLLKAISVAAVAGVGAATYYYAYECRRVPDSIAAIVALATLLTPALVFLVTSTVMPEAVFTLAQLLTVVLLDRARDDAGGLRRSVAAGMMAAASVLIRSAGIAVLGAGILYLLHRRSWRGLAAFAGTAVLCVTPWYLYAGAHAPTAEQSASHGGTIAYAYSDLLTMRRAGDTTAGRAGLADLPARVSRNLVNVFGRDIGGVFVPGFYRGPLESGEETVGLGGAGASMGSAPATMAVSFALSTVVLIGLVVSGRSRFGAADALVAASVAMILLVPTRTFRYLVPLAPFLWLYLAVGLRSVSVWTPGAPSKVATATGIVLFTLVGMQLLEHAQYIAVKSNEPPAADWLADARAVDELVDWMEQNLPPGAPVAATNPGLIYLRTGRRTVALADIAGRREAWKAAGIRYVVALRPTPLPAQSFGFKTLYESRRRWILEI